MSNEILKQYKKFGISTKILQLINEELKLPKERLTSYARPRRLEALQEALGWKMGPNQEKRIFTLLYSVNSYTVGVAKPGKEAASNYKGCRHYITGEKTNNPNDMHLLILKSGEKIGETLAFVDIFDKIEKLMGADQFGLELLGSLLFRAAFMLDHVRDKNGKWRYHLPKLTLKVLEKRIPKISGIPVQVFLHFLEILSLNEDIKVYTLGRNRDFRQDYGRVNTLLTFSHLIAVLLKRRSLSKFAGALARPPSGMAPLPKTKGVEYFPLLFPDLKQPTLKFD